jgi:tetratricopeptide (TPR) repeat protein
MGVALSEYSIVNEIIDSLVLVYPNDPEVVFMAARKLEKTGEVKKAIEKYREGISLDPGRTDNYYQLAALFLEQDDAGSALEVLRPLATSDADLRLALLKADAFSQTEEIDSAARYYNLLVAGKKDSVIYQRLIDMYREHDRYGDLVAISALSADSFPNSKYFLKNAGLVLDKRYQYNDALVYYRQLYELDTLDSMVAQEISILQRKIAYLQRKREVERMEEAIPAIGITLPSLDSLRKD